MEKEEIKKILKEMMMSGELKIDILVDNHPSDEASVEVSISIDNEPLTSSKDTIYFSDE